MMKETDVELRVVKDHIQQLLGQIDDACTKPKLKANREALNKAAQDLHRVADQLVWIVARIK